MTGWIAPNAQAIRPQPALRRQAVRNRFPVLQCSSTATLHPHEALRRPVPLHARGGSRWLFRRRARHGHPQVTPQPPHCRTGNAARHAPAAAVEPSRVSHAGGRSGVSACARHGRCVGGHRSTGGCSAQRACGGPARGHITAAGRDLARRLAGRVCRCPPEAAHRAGPLQHLCRPDRATHRRCHSRGHRAVAVARRGGAPSGGLTACAGGQSHAACPCGSAKNAGRSRQPAVPWPRHACAQPRLGSAGCARPSAGAARPATLCRRQHHRVARSGHRRVGPRHPAAALLPRSAC